MTDPGSDGALQAMAVLFRSVEEGSIGLVTARSEAAAIGRSGDLVPAAVSAISRALGDGTVTDNRWIAVTLGELVLAAAQAAREARPGDANTIEAVFIAGTTLLSLQHIALSERGPEQ